MNNRYTVHMAGIVMRPHPDTFKQAHKIACDNMFGPYKLAMHAAIEEQFAGKLARAWSVSRSGHCRCVYRG